MRRLPYPATLVLLPASLLVFRARESRSEFAQGGRSNKSNF